MSSFVKVEISSNKEQQRDKERGIGLLVSESTRQKHQKNWLSSSSQSIMTMTFANMEIMNYTY
ncbi:hypothetical protein Glove_229g109 [Diversispora epigaea]|uniref:Uncharacterized protein n=1 Tax=Diversispora epigaea TaxID=1348612 RepID=A0A397IFV2_9GLOM|nr:hypothetical protein Glove_229g109 [Diversispora epigaea]